MCLLFIASYHYGFPCSDVEKKKLFHKIQQQQTRIKINNWMAFTLLLINFRIKNNKARRKLCKFSFFFMNFMEHGMDESRRRKANEAKLITFSNHFAQA